MAKDVDLSSKEWRDIVFEGKNKEYGAYVLRQASPSRHNKAMIVIIILMAVIAALAVLVDTVIKQAEARPEDEGEQVLVEMPVEEAPEETPEEEPQKFEEQELEEVVQEELLNTQKMTEILVADDEEVTEDIRSQDDAKEDDRAIGAVNEDRGVDDIINAQEHKEVVVVEEKKPEPEPDKVFEAVEQPPQFPGGDKALLKYISDNLRYPQLAIENNIQGRVVVQFVVTKTGNIGEVKVVRSKDPDLDKEAVRVVKTIPKFQPGKQNGSAVNVWYTLPITFKLSGS
ncbi:MAG: TonB family protein [Pseudoflavonifractor sp.]|nr:TonB family protein [Alloprevotella sp.]MCM1116553.1 TonB family protein [Pseudoflavonifractor sp.]